MSLANEDYVYTTLTNTKIPVEAVSISTNYKKTEILLIYPKN